MEVRLHRDWSLYRGAGVRSVAKGFSRSLHLRRRWNSREYSLTCVHLGPTGSYRCSHPVGDRLKWRNISITLVDLRGGLCVRTAYTAPKPGGPTGPAWGYKIELCSTPIRGESMAT